LREAPEEGWEEEGQSNTLQVLRRDATGTPEMIDSMVGNEEQHSSSNKLGNCTTMYLAMHCGVIGVQG
jgi:hypothetical protein